MWFCTAPFCQNGLLAPKIEEEEKGTTYQPLGPKMTVQHENSNAHTGALPLKVPAADRNDHPQYEIKALKQ